MSVRAYESYDGLETANLATIYNSAASCTVVGGGKTGNALQIAQNASNGLLWIPGDNQATWIRHFHIKLANTSDQNWYRIMDGTDDQLFLGMVSQKLRLYKGNYGAQSILNTATATTLTSGVWYHFQVKTVIHASTGLFEVKINDAVEVTYSGNTKATANAYANRLKFFSDFGGNLLIDNDVIADGQGSINNDYLGVYVPSSEPPTGNGTDRDCTPSTGTDDYAVVDENPPNTTDFLSSSVPTNRTSLAFAASPATAASIKGVKTVWYAQKDAVGARTLTPYVKIGSTRYDGPTAYAMTTAWAFHEYIWELNPATSAAWTKAVVDAAEFGFLVG